MRVRTQQISTLQLEEVTITTETETVISWRRSGGGVHLVDGAKRPTAILVQAGNQQFRFDIPRPEGAE